MDSVSDRENSMQRYADKQQQAPEVATASLARIPDDRLSYAQARHLLWRTSFGATHEDILAFTQLTPQMAVNRVMGWIEAPAGDDEDPGLNPDIIRPPTDAERRRQPSPGWVSEITKRLVTAPSRP